MEPTRKEEGKRVPLETLGKLAPAIIGKVLKRQKKEKGIDTTPDVSAFQSSI
jgi:hypothetical protein